MKTIPKPITKRIAAAQVIRPCLLVAVLGLIAVQLTSGCQTRKVDGGMNPNDPGLRIKGVPVVRGIRIPQQVMQSPDSVMEAKQNPPPLPVPETQEIAIEPAPVPRRYVVPNPPVAPDKPIAPMQIPNAPRPTASEATQVSETKPAGVPQVSSPPNQPATTPPARVVREAIPEITDYRSWTDVTPGGRIVPSMFAMLCKPPDLTGIQDPNPHTQVVNHVYWNKRAMVAPAAGTFKLKPGSVVVKEKRNEKDRPIGLAVMLKQAEGTAPEQGDWAFVFIDKSGARDVVTRGPQTANCADCHSNAKNDFLFMSYMGKPDQ